MPSSDPWQGWLREAWEQWNSFPRWARALYGLTCLLAVLVPAVLLFASRQDRGRGDGDALQATAADASQPAAGEDAAPADQAADAHSPADGRSGGRRGVRNSKSEITRLENEQEETEETEG
jgi:hypothetical protein